MNSHELQKRIQAGDREAFRELYALCGRGVFLRAQEAFSDADITRGIVKQVFLNLHNEIFSSDVPLDIDIRLEALTDVEIRTRRILAGDFAAAEAMKTPSISNAPATEPVKAPSVSDVPPVETVNAPGASDAPAAEAFHAVHETVVADTPPNSAAADNTPYAAEPIPEIFEQAEPYRTPLERAQAHMEAEPPQPRGKKRRPQSEGGKRRGGSVLTTILIAVFLLLFLWLLTGILMDFSILPRFDLGYQWFNDHLFPLFTLTP